MEFLIVSLGTLVALVVAAAGIDLRARRSRRKLSVDPASVRDARRITEARGHLYNQGQDLFQLGHDVGGSFTPGPPPAGPPF